MVKTLLIVFEPNPMQVQGRIDEVKRLLKLLKAEIGSAAVTIQVTEMEQEEIEG